MTVKLSQLLAIGLILLISWAGAAGISVAVVEWRDGSDAAAQEYVDCILSYGRETRFSTVSFGPVPSSAQTSVAALYEFVSRLNGNFEYLGDAHNANWQLFEKWLADAGRVCGGN